MKSAEFDPALDGRILTADAYPHDDEFLTIVLMFIEPNGSWMKHTTATFLTAKVTVIPLHQVSGLSSQYRMPRRTKSRVKPMRVTAVKSGR